MPNLFDHLMAFVLLVGWPVWSAIRGSAEMRDLARHPEKRLRYYWTTIAIQWAATAMLLASWFGAGRGANALGLGADVTAGTGLAAVATLAIGIFFYRRLAAIGTDQAAAADLRSQIQGLEAVLPTTDLEYRSVQVLSVTAGICEEIVYRGFILWYLAHWMPMAGAVLAMAVAFGAVHLYLGPAGAAKAGTLGLIGAGFYLLSGSLWIPMVLHAGLDLAQFAAVRAAIDIPPRRPATPGA